MKHSQQTTRRTHQPFHPLHASLMPLHPLLQLCNRPGCPIPMSCFIWLFSTLRSAKAALQTPSSLSPYFRPYEFTGKSVNTALEKREYNGGVDPSYIRT